MAERAKVDFESGESLLLFRLHIAMAKKEPLDARLESSASELSLSTQLVHVCAERLDGNSLCKITKNENWGEHPITGVMTKYDVDHLEIKELGTQEVQSWSDKKYRKVAIKSGLPPGDWEFDSRVNPGIVPGDTEDPNKFGDVAEDLSEVIETYEELNVLEDPLPEGTDSAFPPDSNWDEKEWDKADSFSWRSHRFNYCSNSG